MRKRPVLFATLAVVVLGAAGATSVFFVGSKQRRDDKRDYLAYERAILVAVDEVRSIGDEMRAQLAGLRGGSRVPVVPPADLTAWSHDLATARSAVSALEPPAFMRDVEARWIRAIDGYVRAHLLLAQASLTAAQEGLDTADTRVEEAARIMQFHRRRLGLGPTPALPDPAATDAP